MTKYALLRDYLRVSSQLQFPITKVNKPKLNLDSSRFVRYTIHVVN